MAVLSRSWLLLWALAGACRRERPAAPADAAPPSTANVSLRAPPLAPDAPSPQCPWDWDGASDLAVPPPVGDAGVEVAAACPAGRLAVAWRVGSAVRVATRALQADASWSSPQEVTDEAASLGRPLADHDALWVPWTTALHALGVARVDDVVQRSELALPGRGELRDPHVVHARGEQCLVAATDHHERADRVVLYRMGLGGAGPPAGAYVAEGAVVATSGGARPVVIAETRVPRTPGGPWLLRAHRLDAAVAFAFASSPAPGTFGVLPGGALASGDALPVGVGRLEYAPIFAERAGALLFETVVGAERGAVRVGWFPARGAPDATTLPMVASGLGAILDAPPGSRDAGPTITYWDDLHAPRRAVVTPAGMGAPDAPGAALEGERAVHDAARRTRWVECGGEPWVVELRREATELRLAARRVACAR